MPLAILRMCFREKVFVGIPLVFVQVVLGSKLICRIVRELIPTCPLLIEKNRRLTTIASTPVLSFKPLSRFFMHPVCYCPVPVNAGDF